MSEFSSQLGPGRIQFHQWCEPPIESGNYTVDVTQSVTQLEAQGDQAFKSQFSFFVAGPRFSLNPSEIYSVYPPKGQAGDFANSLPHVVFTRRTLPWERSVHSGPRQKGDTLPWIALLVFSAADFADSKFPEIQVRSVGELVNPGPGDAFVGPKLELAAYEKREDLCNLIELGWDLFQKVAPALDDLGFLAHVREVDTGNKETLSFLADGWFSVALANRFPEPERPATQAPAAVENRAYLVSLEGLRDYLPGSKSTAGKSVRLAVLSSWSFHCRQAFSFKASMSQLDVRRLAIPPLGNATGTTAEMQVDAAWAQGYTALNHSTRLGEKTVSWYRGPLVPLPLPKQTKFSFRPAADAALRYSPLDGMFDVSYAAAHQLGRLLALQDRHFATALYAYRSDVQRQINDVLGRRRTESVLAGAKGGHESGIMRDYVKQLGASGGPSAGSGGWATAQPVIEREPAEDGSTGVAKKPNELNLTTDFDLTIPPAVGRWLARLTLLYRVPFANLVADERMLPRNSIRFFHLDPNWIKCLLEGACSVGRSNTRDELVDERLRDKFLDFAMEQALAVRTRTPEAGAEEPGPVTSTPAANQPNWPLTGFLLRSPVVEGWLGLEMRAWADGGMQSPLAPLRIDRLAPDILLCIFNGTVNRMEVRQPPEGMHFGAAVEGPGFTRLRLRRLDKSDPGASLDETSKTDIPLREPAVARVVNVSALEQKLRKKLDDLKARDAGSQLTSADFGVQMVESPGQVVFDVAFQEGRNS